MTSRLIITLLGVACVTAGVTQTIPFAPTLQLVQSVVKAKPNDANGQYQLGRVLSYGFGHGHPDQIGGSLRATQSTPVGERYDPKKHYKPGTALNVVIAKQWALTLLDPIHITHDKSPVTAEEKDYLKDALTHYLIAITLKPKSGLYAYGYASMLEELALRYDSVIGKSAFGSFHNSPAVWAKVGSELRRAYGLSKEQDTKSKGLKGPEAYVSRQAAESLLRLGQSGWAQITTAEKKSLQAQIDAVNKIAG